MKTKLYILTIIAALVFTGCDLNQVPGGSTITEDQYQNMDNVTEGTVKGVYSLLYAYGGEHDYFGQRSIDLFGDLLCGDMAMNTQRYGWFMDDAYGRTYQRAGYFWSYYYTIIRNCNKGINALDKQGRPELDFDPATITDEQYKNGFYYAELLTIRGWAYAALQRYFCKTTTEIDIYSELSVPIYTEEATLGDSILGAPRATAADVYLRVEEDLHTAIQYFEAFNQMQRSSKLETNIDVARMTLAYSYLNKGEYDKALKQVEDLLANTTATVLPKEDVLTNGFNNVDSENWIWGQDVTIENTSALASFFGQCDIYSYSYASAGDVKGIDANLLAKIDSVGWDIRRGWWGNYSQENGTTDYQYAPDGKFFSAKSKELMGDRNWLSDNIFMRIETAYLIGAEAAAMHTTNPDYALALDYLTKLTDERVKEGKELEYAAAKVLWASDSKKLKEAINYNWRVEMWGEGYGLQTFRRWGQAVTLGTNQFRSKQTLSPFTDIIFTFIIPTSETNYNPYIRQTTEFAQKQRK